MQEAAGVMESDLILQVVISTSPALLNSQFL